MGYLRATHAASRSVSYNVGYSIVVISIEFSEHSNLCCTHLASIYLPIRTLVSEVRYLEGKVKCLDQKSERIRERV